VDLVDSSHPLGPAALVRTAGLQFFEEGVLLRQLYQLDLALQSLLVEAGWGGEYRPALGSWRDCPPRRSSCKRGSRFRLMPWDLRMPIVCIINSIKDNSSPHLPGLITIHQCQFLNPLLPAVKLA
jgi:hypothetical protein